MDLELLFSVVNASPLPAWLLLVFAPRWRWTQQVVHAAWMPLLLGTAYALLLFTDMGGEGSFFTLEGVMALFVRPQLALAGWIHYLVFDLFVGAWECRDAERVGLKHWMVVPCLFLTLMFGPFGLLLYLLLRGVVKKRWSLVEEQPVADESTTL